MYTKIVRLCGRCYYNKNANQVIHVADIKVKVMTIKIGKYFYQNIEPHCFDKKCMKIYNISDMGTNLSIRNEMLYGYYTKILFKSLPK